MVLKTVQLDKAFGTARTSIRPLPGVQPGMDGEVVPALELPLAKLAREGPLPESWDGGGGGRRGAVRVRGRNNGRPRGVRRSRPHSHVGADHLQEMVPLMAVVGRERMALEHVIAEAAGLGERGPALGARVRLLPRVEPLVLPPVVQSLEGAPAKAALEPPLLLQRRRRGGACRRVVPRPPGRRVRPSAVAIMGRVQAPLVRFN